MDVMPISPDSDSFFSGSKAFLRKLSPNIEMHSRNILIILFLIARLSYSFPVAVPTSSMVPKEVDQRLMIALQASNEDETPTNKADELFEVPSNGSLSKDDSSEDIDNVLDTNGVSIQCQTDCSGGKTDAQVENGMNVCESLPKSNGEIEILDTPGNFDSISFDPTLTSTEEFVKQVERYTLSHLAINHHFLQKVSSASIGKENTAKLLFQFFTAYTRFNKEFAGNVTRLRDIITNPRHKVILDANLAEENGIYNEETLVELEGLGIGRESVQNIPHPELYKDFVANFRMLLQRSYNYDPRDIVPENVEGINKETIAELTADGKFGLLAGIYFGSELIVPELYSKLLQGLRLSCDMSNEDARFLILHIDVDQTHAENLRKIIIDNCVTMEDRIRIVKNTEKILNARVEFYNALISSNIESQNWM